VQLKLRGLEGETRYDVTHLDTSESRVLTGNELKQAGLSVPVKDQPGCAVYAYKRHGN
jgi:hypothetical protein